MRKRIVLISCASKKLHGPAKARELYASSLVKLSLKYAEKLEPDGIYVLSAKHGLLSLNKKIQPYNQTLNEMSVAERKSWSEKVLHQIGRISDVEKTKYIFLAGIKYRQYLLPHMKYYGVPFKGLRIGEQLKKLKELIS